MTDKIQMTEEQARKFFADIFWDYFDSESETLTALNTAKEKGYIIKSELQQKVEEAEDYYRIFRQKDYNMEQEYAFMREALTSCYETLQIFKQSHPEFKK